MLVNFRSIMLRPSRQPRTPCLLAPQTTRPIPRKQPVVMLADNNDLLFQMNRRTTSLLIKSSAAFKTQVFENSSEGIVCYRNESGEMICEGYDEGPRFHRTTNPVSTSHSRDVEIIDLLQKNWVQLGHGSSLYKSKEGAVLLQQQEEYY